MTKKKSFIQKLNQNFNPNDLNCTQKGSENMIQNDTERLLSMNAISDMKNANDLNLSKSANLMNFSNLHISRMYKKKNPIPFNESNSRVMGKSQNDLEMRLRQNNLSNNEPFGRKNSIDYFPKDSEYHLRNSKFEKPNSLRRLNSSAEKKKGIMPNLSGINSSQSQKLLISQTSKPSQSILLISSK
jgi:hypothetical protein